jgi:hypothetical protein
MYSLPMMDAMYLLALAQVCGLGLPLAATGALQQGQASATTGPTLRLDCAGGPSAENSVADFMYFVPLISPEPVVATTDPKANHRVRVLSNTRRFKGATFQVTCDFEFSGNGYERNLFGCGYFLATRKALKNQVILHNVALGMVGKSGVIEARTRYPQV